MSTTSTTRTTTPRTRRAPVRTASRRTTGAASAFASEMPVVSARPPRRVRTVSTPMHADVVPMHAAHTGACVNCAHLPMGVNMLIAILLAFTVAVSSILLAATVIIGAQASRIEALQGPVTTAVIQR